MEASANSEITHKHDEGEKDRFDDCEILMLDESRYYTSFHIATQYYGYIVGRKGAVKSAIERDTRTEIDIPKMGVSKKIVIYGASAANVKAARKRINTIVVESRMKQKPTHFFSIPMNNADIMKNFEQFKVVVLKECSGRGLEESIFMKPHKLHLTLGVICLMDNPEILQVSKLLTEAKNTIVVPLLQDYFPLKIRLKGISYMNDDPKDINVLYGCVQEEAAPTGLLQKLTDNLGQYFNREGFRTTTHGRATVNLHVTLLNSKYRGRQGAGADEIPRWRRARIPRESFDGSQILQKFADYDFGVMELTHIHLSDMSSKAADGYYQSKCIISCNSSDEQ